MFRNKKRFIVMPLLVAVLLAGSAAGIAQAQEGSPEASPRTTFMKTAAESLGITLEELQSAISEAREYVRGLDVENKAEVFKAKVSEILGMDFQSALDSARAALQEQVEARREEMQVRLQARVAELQGNLEARRVELQQRLQTRLSECQERLEARGAELKQRLQNRLTEMQGKFGNLQPNMQQHGAGNGQGNQD